MPRIVDRRFRSEFEWNADGKIHRMKCTRCAHGNHIIIEAPGTEQGKHWDFCMKCMAPICLSCAQEMKDRGGECVAFEKALLNYEARAAMEGRIEADAMDRAASRGSNDRRFPLVHRELATLLAATR